MINASLIQGCHDNDRRAQRELYNIVYPVLMRVAKRYVTNEEDAVEITTNSYMKVLKNLDAITHDMVIEAWVRRIGINTAIDWIRSQKRYREAIKLNADYSYNAIENLHVELTTAQQEMEAGYVYKIIDALPPVTKEVLNLYAIDGYNHQEISSLLGITYEMSRWHLFRGRKLVTEQLKQYQDHNKKYKT